MVNDQLYRIMGSQLRQVIPARNVLGQEQKDHIQHNHENIGDFDQLPCIITCLSVFSGPHASAYDCHQRQAHRRPGNIGQHLHRARAGVCRDCRCPES